MMKRGDNNSIYNQMPRMAEPRITMILAAKLTRTKKFMDAAERLFSTDNFQSRNAVSKICMHDVSLVPELLHYHVQILLPVCLRKEYVKQNNAFY